MGGDDLDELVLVAPEREQEPGGREVLRLPLAKRQRLVGDALDDVLEEGVLATLGRARVGLDGEDFLPEQRGEQRLQLVGRNARHRAQPLLREGLAEHSAVLHQPPLLRRQPVEPGGYERVKRLGHLELLDRSGRSIDGAVPRQQATVEQHAGRFHRVQGHPLGAFENSPAQVVE